METGTYHGSLFRIILETSERLDNLIDLSSEVRAAYFHEYTHFLQSIALADYMNYGTIWIEQTKALIKF